MSKRKAATDLNHDNWDREEEPETAGTFQTASKEIVQDRVIRVAKRRLPAGSSASPSSENSSEPKKLFSGFSGFGTMKSSGNLSSVSEIAKSSFSFLNKTDSHKSNLKSCNTPLNKTNSSETKTGNGNTDGDANQTYLGKLRGLNEAVVDWIKEHVDKNPCCILTPVFNDYEKFLKEIQQEKDKASSTTKLESSKETSTFSTNSENKSALFSFLNNKDSEKSTFSVGDKGQSPLTKKESPEKAVPPSFSFGSKNASENKINFSFGTVGDQSKQFSLGGNKHASSESTDGPPEKKSFFNFGSADKPSSDSTKFATSLFGGPPAGGGFFKDLSKPSETTTENNEEDDEEPKPEPVKPVTEDDALFSQRVKVFVKKGEEYKDLGVGNLFIKEAPNGWHQALVRNDTSLGNIIFNILLSQQQPTKRMGKNNVMIVCQPTPQHTGPAVPVLLRVKTSDDADKLLETIDKYKKK